MRLLLHKTLPRINNSNFLPHSRLRSFRSRRFPLFPRLKTSPEIPTLVQSNPTSAPGRRNPPHKRAQAGLKRRNYNFGAPPPLFPPIFPPFSLFPPIFPLYFPLFFPIFPLFYPYFSLNFPFIFLPLFSAHPWRHNLPWAPPSLSKSFLKFLFFSLKTRPPRAEFRGNFIPDSAGNSKSF